MTRTRSRRGAPGIVEVAARAGVSIATVSRAFNAPQIVAAETRKQIEAAARQLGYQQDLTSGTLGPGFSGTIGMIVPTVDNAIFSEMVESFSRRLNEHGRTMLIATHGYDLSLEVPIVRALIRRKIDGVVLIGLDHLDTSIDMLRDRAIPILAIWNHHADASIPCIGTDNRQVGATAIRHLLDLGHRDIGLLFPETARNDRARDRFTGALEEAAAANAPIRPERIISCPYDIGAAKDTMARVLAAGPPTAVLCGNDVIAHGVLYACQAAGVAVPDRLSVIGIGDFAGSAYIEPGLTTVRMPARRIGAMAADSIVEASRRGADPTPEATAVDFALIVRQSTGPPPAR
ncbi:substrate-binding domain-containing protein [Paracoccus sp. Z118]|uniref:substrate-binding domain-containing protein n=1 Tax=Paracoccus sp. Z118 TaxID=2851017 RepID=UPI001C2BDEA0|nr:substrate-binding domain-containing protein [Paracoccus sp. Z118]MBV0892650.1 substrate-binding domain-containing protein [Paracoccus sp. Z118]